MDLKKTMLVAGVGVIALTTIPAHAQRTRFQGISQCSRYAQVQFSRSDPAFRRFQIERITVQDDKYANMVGNQFISTIYYGRATYEGAGTPKRVRFICLHSGISKGPVFIYTMPE